LKIAEPCAPFFRGLLHSFKTAFTLGSARIVKTEIGWWGRKIQPVTVSAGVNASNSPKPQRWLIRLESHRAGVLLQPYALKRVP